MKDSIPTLIQKVEALLPQTQCERCGHPGCRPYAESVVRDQASVAKCFPGGQVTADAIAKLLKREQETVQEAPGPKLLAQVIEADCIGCTKCIQACPVDAIVGAPKMMHTILATECTGCELCVPACPMDCIEMTPTQEPSWLTDLSSQALAHYSKQRTIARQERLNRQMSQKANTRKVKTNLDIQQALKASIERAQNKKNQAHEREKMSGNF